MKTEEMNDKKRPRIFYIDNLRIFLIGLVVLHHFAITYGAPGGWFYNESIADFPEIIPLSMFVATNQAFFMGMFFFISAFFIIPSLNKKGIKLFSKDRLIRLGIPTILFYFLLFPLTIYIRNNFILDRPISFVELLQMGEFGFGPMWFVEALLLFTFVYLLINYLSNKDDNIKPIPFPGSNKIIILICLIGFGQFIIRIWLPVGWAMPFTNFQFPHFLQYIVLFAFGIIAYKNEWMDHVTPSLGWKWFGFVNILILIGFPALFVLGGAMENGIDDFMGGLNFKSLSYCIWEQLVGFGMIIGLFGIFKSKLNSQGSIGKNLSASAYAVYVFHTPIIIGISAIFLSFNIPQLLKFVVLAPIAIITCFVIGYLIKKIPILKDIF